MQNERTRMARFPNSVVSFNVLLRFPCWNSHMFQRLGSDRWKSRRMGWAAEITCWDAMHGAETTPANHLASHQLQSQSGSIEIDSMRFRVCSGRLALYMILHRRLRLALSSTRAYVHVSTGQERAGPRRVASSNSMTDEWEPLPQRKRSRRALASTMETAVSLNCSIGPYRIASRIRSEAIGHPPHPTDPSSYTHTRSPRRRPPTPTPPLERRLPTPGRARTHRGRRRRRRPLRGTRPRTRPTWRRWTRPCWRGRRRGGRRGRAGRAGWETTGWPGSFTSTWIIRRTCSCTRGART